MLQLDLGNFDAGADDLREAARLYRRAGLTVGAADSLHNLGSIEARRGDVAAALLAFDAAEDELRALGVPTALFALERAEVFHSLRLAGEAREAVEAATAGLTAAGMGVDVPVADLLMAQILLLQRDPGAEAVAARARIAFSRQRRGGWAAFARFVEVDAAYRSGNVGTTTMRRAQAAAAALALAGLPVHAAEAELLAGRLALLVGRPDVARCAFASAVLTSPPLTLPSRCRTPWSGRPP